jgi:hypothetical protein
MGKPAAPSRGLPKSLLQWVEHQAKQSGFPSTDAYIAELVKRERRREEWAEEVERKVLESIRENQYVEYTPTMLDDIRAKGRARREVNARRTRKSA